MTRDHRMTAGRVAAAFLVLLLVGCASTTTPSVLTPSSSPSAVAVVPSAAPSTVMPPSTATVSCVDGTLASMSEAQRIGQVFMIGLVKDRLDATERAAVADFHFGSFAFTTQSTAGVEAIRAITDAVQGLATRKATVGWGSRRRQSGGWPDPGPCRSRVRHHPARPDAGGHVRRDPQERRRAMGAELGQAGVNVDLAPVADVVPPGADASNAPIGQLQREYGHDPATAASHVRAFIAGMTQAGIDTSAKHFPGLGRVVGNTDFTGDVWTRSPSAMTRISNPLRRRSAPASRS